MASYARYLWGHTKAQYITFKPSAAPLGAPGRMYFDSTVNAFKFCEDGTSFEMIRDVLHN